MKYPEKQLREAALLRDMELEKLNVLQCPKRADIEQEQSSWFNVHENKLARVEFFKQFADQIGTFNTKRELSEAQELFLSNYITKRTKEIEQQYLHRVEPLWRKWFSENGKLEDFIDLIIARDKRKSHINY
jgi:hypothetical protein